MKCPACGGQMGLEDAVCPYCGTPNAQAAQHQSDMARYKQEYQRTQADVLENTSLLRQHGSWLVILTVLLVALIAGIILNVYAWDIGYSIRTDAVQRETAQDQAKLDAFLEQGDYGQFFGYYDANDISLDSDNPYQALRTAAAAYVDIVQYIAALGDSNDFQFRPDYVENTCTYIAEDINRIYTVEQQYSYDLDKYLPPDKLVYLEDIRERTAAIAKTYFGLSDADIDEIPNVSKRKLSRMIEENITE